MENKSIINGFKWTTIEMIVNRSFGFLVKLILARFLFPEDYGLVGMAVVFTTFFNVFTDLGIGKAIIQRDSGQLNQTYLSTSFWTSLIWGLLLYTILLTIIIPLSVSFFNEPKLKLIITFLGSCVVFYSLSSVHKSLLAREMKFKKIALSNNISNILAGSIAIILAIFDYGVWALVFFSVVQAFVDSMLILSFSNWKPLFTWKKESFNDFIGFGFFSSLSGLLNRAYNQGDYFIVAKLLGKSDLGFYSFAFILTDSIRIQIKSIIDKVLYPVYSKFKNDKQKQEEILKRSIYFNASIVSPILMVLFACTEWIVIIFGEKWMESLVIIKIISLTALVQVLTNSLNLILLSNNQYKIDFKIQMIMLVFIFIPLVYFGTSSFGIIGTAFSILLFRILFTCVNLFVMRRILDFNIHDILTVFFKSILPSFIPAIVSYAISFKVNVKPSNLVFLIAASTIIVLSSAYFFIIKDKAYLLLKK